MADHTAIISDIHRLSTHDGPGMRTTVFFKGCPLHCVWCQNPETIDPESHLEWDAAKCLHCGDCMQSCASGALKISSRMEWDRRACRHCNACAQACPSKALKVSGFEAGIDELMQTIEKDRVFFENSKGGVTFSGGEPLLQAEFLSRLAERCRQAGISVALDTCGAVPLSGILDLLPKIDYLLWDIKIVDPALHLRHTGVSSEPILDNLVSILAMDCDLLPEIWIRTPLIPGLTANDDNIIDIADFLQNHLNPALRVWELCAFNNLCADRYVKMGLEWPLEGVPLLANARLEHFYDMACGIVGDTVEVRTAGLTGKN